MVETDVLILGGGAAGLAARAGLAGHRSCAVVEAEPEVGGLLRVFPREGFVFDSVVHVLSFRDRGLEAALIARLPGGVRRFSKHNLVWQGGRVIDYPYQYNAHQLPEPIRRECLREFEGRPPAPSGGASFEAWLVAQFGGGFFRHFFRPYNVKLYGDCLGELEPAPMVWTIPADDAAAVRQGGGAQPRRPSAPCWYPAGARGISALVDALGAMGEGRVLLGERVVKVDLQRKTVRTSGGLEIRYRHLINTLPLPALVELATPVPEPLAEASRTLRARSVHVVQVGVRDCTPALPAHWTYFPDPDVPFYRLTRLERISPDLCPDGASALLLEHAGPTPPDRGEVEAWLRRLGVIGTGALAWYGVHTIAHAYVLFRRGYREVVDGIRAHLARHDVITAGRYGGWRYANIEQTLEEGFDAARQLTPDAARKEEAPTWVQ